MQLVLVVSMLSLLPSVSPSTGTERTHALESPEELKVLDEAIVDSAQDNEESDGLDEAGATGFQGRALLTGALMGGLTTVVAHVLGYVGSYVGGGVLALTAGVAFAALTGSLSTAAESFVFLPFLGFVLGYLGVFTFCLAVALDVVTDGWIAIIVAPLLASLTLVGPPIGLVVGGVVGTVGSLAVAAALGFALGFEPGSYDAQGLALLAVMFGSVAGIIGGGILGYGVTSFVIPTGVIALLADDITEWRRPFTSFTE